MSSKTRILILITSVLLCGCVQEGLEHVSEPSDDYRQVQKVSIIPDLSRAESLWAEVYASSDGFDVTTYFDFIIEASAAGWDEEKILWTINKIRSLQIQEGELLGRVPRTLAPSLSYSDANNIEFVLQLAVVALVEYYPQWSEETKEAFDDFLDKSIYALWKHDNVAPTYSNVYIMHTWNLIALGEYLDSSRTWGGPLSLSPAYLAEKGYEALDEFYRNTAYCGIHEHNSPTYIGVMAETIGFLCNYLKNVKALNQALKIRDYLSLMICSNYYTPASSDSGAMGRCYYRGGSNGKIDQLARGMIRGHSMYAYNQHAAWILSAEAKTLNATYPRLVAYVFGDEKAVYADGNSYWQMNAINYVDKYYSVASAGHHYTGNGTEKQLNIMVRTDEHPVNINFAHYMEGRDDPYGFKPMNSSHVWTCFRDAYARSQHNNQFVALQAGNGRDNPSASNLCSHILIPKTNVDEIWVDDKKITDYSSSPEGNTFFIKIDHVVVSIRFLYAFGKDGSARTHQLIEDDASQIRNYYVLADGNRHTALRITTILNDQAPAVNDLSGVAMWWRADDCIRTPDQFARLRKSVLDAEVSVPSQKRFVSGDTFDCHVMTPEGVKLGVKGTFSKKSYYNRYIYTDETPEYLSEKNWTFDQTEAYGSSVDFSNYCAAFFSVNGWDMGREIFNE